MYSVASAPDGGVDRISNRLELTVAQLRYPADLGLPEPATGHADQGERLGGTASTYLNQTADGEAIPIQLVRPSRFALPRDRSRPIVMFAGGVGIAPFRGFIADRSDEESGENWLFYATRSSGQLAKRLNEFEHLYNEIAEPFGWNFTREKLNAWLDRLADRQPVALTLAA